MSPSLRVMSQRVAGAERYRVSCFPLNHLLDAIGVDHVDYFSLDVQGAELQILKTIDFNAVRIDIVIVEVEDPSDGNNLKKLESEMRAFFNQTGLYKEAKKPNPRDLMFERIDLQ